MFCCCYSRLCVFFLNFASNAWIKRESFFFLNHEIEGLRTNERSKMVWTLQTQKRSNSTNFVPFGYCIQISDGSFWFLCCMLNGMRRSANCNCSDHFSAFEQRATKVEIWFVLVLFLLSLSREYKIACLFTSTKPLKIHQYKPSLLKKKWSEIW